MKLIIDNISYPGKKAREDACSLPSETGGIPPDSKTKFLFPRLEKTFKNK